MRQSVLVETARTVQAFLATNTDVIGPTITTARHNLDDAVNQLAAMAVTQASSKTSSKGPASLQAKLRLSLRNNFMKPVATVAKLFAANVPEINALSMPKKQLSSAALVASAHAMADAAEKYSDTFTKNGLPQDFVPQLRSAGGGCTTSSPPTASASSGASSSGRSTAAAAPATASPASAAQSPAGSPEPA